MTFKIITQLVETVTRFAAHFTFAGAVSLDVTGIEHLHLLALGLYFLSFMIDHVQNG